MTVVYLDYDLGAPGLWQLVIRIIAPGYPYYGLRVSILWPMGVRIMVLGYPYYGP